MSFETTRTGPVSDRVTTASDDWPAAPMASPPAGGSPHDPEVQHAEAVALVIDAVLTLGARDRVAAQVWAEQRIREATRTLLEQTGGAP